MRTILLKNPVYLLNGYSVVGPLEGKGPLKEYFDYVLQDDTLKEKSFEKAECKMFKYAIDGVLNKSKHG